MYVMYVHVLFAREAQACVLRSRGITNDYDTKVPSTLHTYYITFDKLALPSTTHHPN